jgi:hypothetical protein
MLATVHAYMDESADKDRRLFTIGGFLGRSDEWRDLRFRWIERIERSKLPRPIKAFHMTDCENGGGEFRDELGWDRDSRRRLIIDLIDLICSYNLGVFGMAIPIQEYESLEPVNSEGVKLGRNQYCFLMQAVMTELAIEFEKNGFGSHETIDFFFDRNSPHEHWGETAAQGHTKH